MKKRILFVIDSLRCGGAEKSLVSLLSNIDYTNYDIDLQLFARNGDFEKFIPATVNILSLPDYLQYSSLGLSKNFFCTKPKYLFSRIKYSLSIRIDKNSTHTKKAMLYWKCTSKCFNTLSKHYDVAIAYAQGIPTFFVAEKVNATKKFAWVNATLIFDSQTQKYNETLYSVYDKIIPVSANTKKILSNLFPQYICKLHVIADLIDFNFITKMSDEESPKELKKDHFTILTCARLDNGHKGYDIALDACKILHDRGVKFRWYAIGEGTFRNEMEKFIAENNLQDIFILLGTKENPYPYFSACDIYVQTSRHEGFGLSIAEARILNKPVVTTEFDAVWNQMVQGKNGIVVPVDATAVADAIQDLIAHPQKREAISAYQSTEKKGNIEELQKFYNLIND